MSTEMPRIPPVFQECFITLDNFFIEMNYHNSEGDFYSTAAHLGEDVSFGSSVRRIY